MTERCPAHAPELPSRFDPLAPEQLEDPFGLLALARREQPVFYAPELDLWVVTRYADVLAVLKDHRSFSSTGALRSASAVLPAAVREVLDEAFPAMPYIIEIDPPLHDRIRALVTGAFTPRRIAALEPAIRRIVGELLDELPARGETDLIGAFAWPLPLRVLGELLGLPRADLPQLHAWGSDWILVQQDGPLEQRVAHARGTASLQRYFMEAVEQREQEPTDDLIGALVAGRAGLDEPLTNEEIAGLPLDLMVAGHVTVTRAIGNTIGLLFRDPAVREALLDPAGAGRAIEEILRLESPAQGLFRRHAARRRGGRDDDPAGSRVMVHFASANRDERSFAGSGLRAGARELGRHLAFGKGIHFCIGRRSRASSSRSRCRRCSSGCVDLRPARRGVREPLFFARGFARLAVDGEGRSVEVGDRHRCGQRHRAGVFACARRGWLRGRRRGYRPSDGSSPRSWQPAAARSRVAVDVSDRRSTEAMAAATLERFGRIDASSTTPPTTPRSSSRASWI